MQLVVSHLYAYHPSVKEEEYLLCQVVPLSLFIDVTTDIAVRELRGSESGPKAQCWCVAAWGQTATLL